MNYVATTIEALRAQLPENDGTDEDLLRAYALLVHTTGTGTSLEHVHDAWALWRAQTRPEHPDLVPFAQLSAQVADYDQPYRDAIRTVAAALSGN